tara:strand:- start:128 stop:415 length:288 start_codon:yes stop_codon:yes gene_type:complete
MATEKVHVNKSESRISNEALLILLGEFTGSFVVKHFSSEQYNCPITACQSYLEGVRDASDWCEALLLTGNQYLSLYEAMRPYTKALKEMEKEDNS